MHVSTGVANAWHFRMYCVVCEDVKEIEEELCL